MSGLSSKPGTPVVGFNHNLNHKGRVFHVQTEDSGPQHGHIITHIFMGGNILASTKGTYAELLASTAPGDVSAAVRKLMEDQHKTMIKRLVGGAHDAEIAKRTGSDTFYEPGVLANGARAPGLLIGGDSSGPPSAPSAVATRPDLRPVPAAPMSLPPSSPVAALAAVPPSLPGRPRPPAPGALPSSVPRVAQVRPGAPVHVPPVMTPAPAIAAPVSRPSSPPSFPPSLPVAHRALDEIILSYLISDLESPRR